MHPTQCSWFNLGLALLLVAIGCYFEWERRNIHMPVATSLVLLPPPASDKVSLQRKGDRTVLTESATDTPKLHEMKREDWERLKANFVPSPESERRHRYQVRVRLMFGPLYGKLGLTPKQIEQFEEAAAENFNKINYLSTQRDLGSTTQDEEILRATLSGLLPVVRRTLGADYSAAFEEYVPTIPLRGDLGNIATAAGLLGVPFSKQQLESLFQTLVDNSSGSAEVPIKRGDQVNWSSVLESSSAQLSAEQMEALRNYIAAREFDEEFVRITGLTDRKRMRGI